ncbi:MAG: HDOD domain-containing protein [Desulfovibrionaceae bacterium]
MKKRILFVDDDTMILQGIRRLLHSKRNEWDVRYAASGEEALSLIGQDAFEVVVTDMRMPGMGGAQLLEKVRALLPCAVRIVLSGQSEMGTLMQAATLGHQFLSKPCSSDELIGTLNRVLDLHGILTNEAVRRTVSGLASLPALPNAYVEIVQELRKSSPSLDRVGRIVERDMALSAMFLKLVNSSFFGFYQKIMHPAQAVTLLGADILQGMILGAHLFATLKPKDNLPFALNLLWAHCFRVGCLARTIGMAQGLAEDALTTCYTAGLLHDVGKLVLAVSFTSEYRTILDRVREQGESVSQAELAVLGVTHAEVGAYLLGVWGLGQETVKSVYCHHALDRVEAGGMSPAVAVHAADCLDHKLVNLNAYRVPEPDMAWLEKEGLLPCLPKWEEESGKACAEISEE